MKLRYFVLDRKKQLREASQAAVQALWEGRLRVDAFHCPLKHEVHLVSVVCDGRLLPRKVYLLRLPLEQGTFTAASYLMLQAFTRPDCITRQEAIAHHTEGWPPDLFPQLAVVLDVALAAFNVPLAIGGPLLLASAMDVTPRQALRHLR